MLKRKRKWILMILSGMCLFGCSKSETFMVQKGDPFDPTGVLSVKICTLSQLLGDANHDGVVSSDDYVSVQANFGATGEPGIPGDANYDGLVSADDTNAVQTNFGSVASATRQSSGFVVGKDGSKYFVVTYFNTGEKEAVVNVDSEEMQTEVVARNTDSGLALLSFQSEDELLVYQTAKSFKHDQVVLVVGRPSDEDNLPSFMPLGDLMVVGEFLFVVTLSFDEYPYRAVPGMFGSPVFDTDGKVVGMVHAINYIVRGTTTILLVSCIPVEDIDELLVGIRNE